MAGPSVFTHTLHIVRAYLRFCHLEVVMVVVLLLLPLLLLLSLLSTWCVHAQLQRTPSPRGDTLMVKPILI